MNPKNWVHYVQKTGPVESLKIEDDDFSIWSLNQFAKYTPYSEMVPFWKNAQAFGNCRIQNRCMYSGFFLF